MSPANVALAILLIGIVALVGKLVRVKSKTAQKLFLPVSIIGGFLALFLGPEVLGRIAGAAGLTSLEEGVIFTRDILDVWGNLPSLLISAVFATMFLGQRLPSPKRAVRLLGPQLSLGITFASGQYVVGILLAILVLVPVFGVSPLFGTLIEIGFEGGHGTAAGMAPMLEQMGFEGGGDLALASATIGILMGVIIGVFFVNWAARRGHAAYLSPDQQVSGTGATGVYAKDERPYGSILTIRSESLDSLTYHFGIVAVSILIGQLMLSGLQAIESAVWADTVEIFAFVPLFPLAMLGGVVVQMATEKVGLDSYTDPGMMYRIQGLSLDVLIISALGSLSLDAIASNLGPFGLLMVAGIGWNCFVLFVLAPRFIRKYWVERGVGDFGQSMGVTATGLLLMRMADPENRSPAYEAFGYKQLIFEPFFGGGLITAAAVPLIAQFGPYPFLIAMAAILLIGLLSGLFYFGRLAKFEVEGRGSAEATTS